MSYVLLFKKSVYGWTFLCDRGAYFCISVKRKYLIV